MQAQSTKIDTDHQKRKMTTFPVKRQAAKKPRKMELGYYVIKLLGPLIWLYFWLFPKQPKLALIHKFVPGIRSTPQAGEIYFFLKNTGKAPAQGCVITLRIIKPEGLHPGHGLFFESEIGNLESSDEPSAPWSPLRRHKPTACRYRLKPDVFVNPEPDEPLKIAKVVTFAAAKKKPGDLDYEIEWFISCAGLPPTTGKIKIDGFGLKRTLMTNLHNGVNVIA